MEWMLSCERSPGSEVAAIRAVLSEGAELEAATERAREALAELQSALSANAQVHGRPAVPCNGGLEQSVNQQTAP